MVNDYQFPRPALHSHGPSCLCRFRAPSHSPSGAVWKERCIAELLLVLPSSPSPVKCSWWIVWVVKRGTELIQTTFVWRGTELIRTMFAKLRCYVVFCEVLHRALPFPRTPAIGGHQPTLCREAQRKGIVPYSQRKVLGRRGVKLRNFICRPRAIAKGHMTNFFFPMSLPELPSAFSRQFCS